MARLFVVVLLLFLASAVNARELLQHPEEHAQAPSPMASRYSFSSSKGMGPMSSSESEGMGSTSSEYDFNPAEGPSTSPSGEDWSTRQIVPVGVRLTHCTRPGLWALTFDDGPSVKTTHKVLDALKKNKIHATFFVIGENLMESEQSMDLTRRAFNEGHLIASHSYTHPDFTTLTEKEMVEELKITSDAIHEVIGKRPRYFRPPYGYTDDSVMEVLKTEKYKTTLWNLDPRDWESRNVAKIFDFFQSALETSDPETDNVVSLTHDIVPATSEVVGDLITIIREKGFKFVRIDDCFNDMESPYW